MLDQVFEMIIKGRTLPICIDLYENTSQEHWKIFIADSLRNTGNSHWLLHNSEPIMMQAHSVSKMQF